MKVMLVFDAVILLFGIYMVISSLQMKKSGRINAMVIAEEEMKKCKDTAGFIAFIYWREAVFGGIVALVMAVTQPSHKPVIVMNRKNVNLWEKMGRYGTYFSCRR